MLAGIYYGSQYGGSTTSILMRIPGEAVLGDDLHRRLRHGAERAAPAPRFASRRSAPGSAGTFGVIVLTLVAPPLATLALRFGPPEYTALLVLGLIFLAYMSSTSLIRTLLMACLGLLLGMIGIDNMTGHFRYCVRPRRTRRRHRHRAGRGRPVRARRNPVDAERAGGRQGDRAEAARAAAQPRRNGAKSAMPIARGTVLGFLIGIIPGSAHIISSFLSYALEKRVSKHPEEFGKGAVAGVAGPESANNAASTGAFVPMLALGIPTEPDHRGADRRADDPRRAARADAGQRSSRRVLGLRRLDVCRQPDAARAQPAAGRPVRDRAAHPLRLSLSAHHHVLHHRRLRGEQLDRRRLDHADHGRARLCAAQVRFRSRAAGARPRDRADPRAEPAPVADHVERQLPDLLQPADRAVAADRQRRPAAALGLRLPAQAGRLARQARRGGSGGSRAAATSRRRPSRESGGRGERPARSRRATSAAAQLTPTAALSPSPCRCRRRIRRSR